jgi:hypothetical protein
MHKHGFTHARYIDDLVELTTTRARLRKLIKATNQALALWGYKLHTNEQTFIGKIAIGFNFCRFKLFYDKILLE